MTDRELIEAARIALSELDYANERPSPAVLRAVLERFIDQVNFKEEKSKWAKAALCNNTGTLKTPRRIIGTDDY